MMIDKDNISGKTREYSSFLEPLQLKLVKVMVPRVPKQIETYHLTLFSFPLAMSMILIGWLSKSNIQWLWGASILIIIQYFSDILDGAVGRARNTGLVLWGYFSDHIFDSIFFSSYFFALLLVFPNDLYILFVALVMAFLTWVYELLLCIIYGKYNTSGYDGFGGTETRLLLIVFNAIVILARLKSLLIPLLVVIVLYGWQIIPRIGRSMKEIWELDMKNKRNA